MYYDRREQRRQRRLYRRAYRSPLRGFAGGIFLIALAFAFFFSGTFGGHGFLFFLFVGLAFCSLLGAASSLNPRALYGGLYSFTWLMGLALCFLIGFWPWILLPVGVSMILGALYAPLIGGLLGLGFLAATQANQPPMQQYQQPTQPYQPPQQGQEPYQSYQQGYQPPPQMPGIQAPGSYEEGGQQHEYPQQPQPKQQYDMPETQYPQEMPPQEQ